MADQATTSARHLRLISTNLAEEVEDNLRATEWLACSECAQEYRAFEQEDGSVKSPALVGGVCDRCREEKARVDKELCSIFNRRQMLIEMSKARFETTAENSKAYIAARDFDPVKENLYLWGTAGSGKTMLASKIIHKAISKKQSCAFVITEQWLRSLYGLSGLEQQASIDRLVSVRVLVFDEVGFEPSTEFSARALYDVINSRMLENRNGLVVTTNLFLTELRDRLKDDRITSRLGGMCKIEKLSGRDWRQPE
jgi:DNA replication protein DnaC